MKDSCSGLKYHLLGDWSDIENEHNKKTKEGQT